MKFEGVGFFQERQGVRSNMRLMCFMTLIFAFYMTWLIVSAHLAQTTPITPYEMGVIALLFVAAFAPKAVQKFAENSDLLNKGNGTK